MTPGYSHHAQCARVKLSAPELKSLVALEVLLLSIDVRNKETSQHSLRKGHNKQVMDKQIVAEIVFYGRSCD